MSEKPEITGIGRTFGFGDRLGLATPGHIEVARDFAFAPIFAQQSIREMARTGRSPEDVMRTAADAVVKEGWKNPWGADADHLQTPEDAIATARAGFTMFTIDPGAHVNNAAGRMRESEIDDALKTLEEKCNVEHARVMDEYLGKKFDMGEGPALKFPSRRELDRACLKYGGAVAHAKKMHGAIREACGGRPFEVELSVDETDTPTSPLEHLFIGLELKRRGVRITSLAPRFIGEFEKGIDYKGDLEEFGRQFRLHVGIAKHCGPYKISIHSGSDKFSLYPVIGRLSGELLHVKTAGTSYLEALRVVSRTDPELFGEIAAFCRGRYEQDRATYHVSAGLADLPTRVADREMEKTFLDTNSGRQVLHVTYGSVLLMTGEARLKDRILENLARNDATHREVLKDHLGKHLRLLSS